MENTKPTFQDQYNKIVKAYMKNELNPFKSCACFIGNLLNEKYDWGRVRTITSESQYMTEIGGRVVFIDVPMAIPINDISREIDDMLGSNVGFNKGLNCIKENSGGLYTVEDIVKLEKNFLSFLPLNSMFESIYSEEDLFLAMESTLLMLKEIHQSKGEVIKDYTFKKRHLQEEVQ